MKKANSKLFKWGFKQQVLYLALIPPITISILLGTYFITIRLGELNQALTDRGTAVVTRLASQGEYGVFAGDYSALRRLAQREISEEITSVSFYDKDAIEIASAGNLSATIEPQKISAHHQVIIKEEADDVISFITPVTLPEVIIDDDVESGKVLEDNALKSTVIGWLKVEIERRATRLKSYQVFIQSCMIVFLGVCMSCLLAMRLDNIVSTPILALVDAVKKIRNGNLDTRVPVNSNWELQVLESGMNMMASSLQRSHIEMQKNINQATIDLRKTLETIEIQNIELQKARKKAEAANKVKSEFLANMSHELRTPLNAITGFINLIKKTKLSGQQEDYLNTIDKASRSLLAIINDILDFSKLEAGKLRLSYEKMNLRSCLDNTLAMLAPSAHEKDLELVNFIYPEVPEHIECDELRFRQVITNLVSNAIKFTESGSVIVRIMVEQEKRNKIVLYFSVTDTGIGLSKSQQDQLFASFSQANPNISRKFGGTGLGLVICKKIITQMKGKIALESELNQGTTFWFTMPVKKEKNLENTRNESYKDKKVIVFEQQQISRIVAMNILASCGAIVSERDDVDDLITTVDNSDDIDIVFLGMNNNFLVVEEVQAIIQKLKLKNVTVVAVINTTDHAVHGDVLSYGADYCIAKPISKQKVISITEEISSDDVSLTKKERKPLKVLAVDDNFANMKLITVLLKALGVDVVTAVDGKQAVDSCRKDMFDIIFMDINMPVMDGIEATGQIRTLNNSNAKAPIIALSAHVQTEDRQRFLSSGVNDTITKPILEHELKAILYKWTSSKAKGAKDKEVAVKNQTSNKNLDWDLSLKLAGNNEELAKEILSMTYVSIQEELQKLSIAVDSENWIEAGNVAHKMHGGCCYVGVPKLKNVIAEFEECAKSHKNDLLPALLDEVSIAVRDFINEYDKAFADEEALA